MNKLTSIILASLFLSACQTTPTQVRKSKPYPVSPQPKAVEKLKPKVHGHWFPDVSRVFCITGNIAVKYDDTLGVVEEGTFDKLAKGFKWKAVNQLRVVKSSTEEISGTPVYSIRYKSDPIYITQRAVFGTSEIHSKLSGFDIVLKKEGFKRMNGDISIGRDKIDNPSACWGISVADRWEKINASIADRWEKINASEAPKELRDMERPNK